MAKHSRDADARKERDALTAYESRLQALLDALGEKQEYTKMDLFTHTSHIYVRGFLEAAAHLKALRRRVAEALLVVFPTCLSTLQTNLYGKLVCVKSFVLTTGVE